MDYFTVVEDAACILLVKGVYKQAHVYKRGDNYYAKHGGGYIRLLRHNVTSVPAIRWLEGDGFEIETPRAQLRKVA